MPHMLILGRTGSGKTTIAIQMAAAYQRRGVANLVYDPIGDSRWRAVSAVCTDNFWEFQSTVRRSTSCAVWVDESAEVLAHHDLENQWLATRARHLGHNSHFIAQRAQQISTTVRGQCERLVAFALAGQDGKVLAAEWAHDELLEVTSLERGEYLTCARFGPLERGKLSFS